MSPRYLLCVFTYIALISLSAEHPKGDDLRKRTLEAENGMILFDAQSFKEYVMTHPRPYDVAILFTLKRKCNLCDRVKDEFVQVAESFRDKEGYKPDKVNRRRAVFFGALYYSDATSAIFKNLKFPSMTSILYTTPQNIQMDDKGELQIKYDEEYVISYKENSDKIYAQKMMEFANAKSERKFPLKKNPIEFLCYFAIFIGLLFIGFSIYKNFKDLFLSPKLWLIGSLAVYIICIGGIVYNVLRGTRFAKFDRDGNIVEFIHTGQRSQYIGEGILMSSLFVLSGTVLYSFNWINKIKGYRAHTAASIIAIFVSLILIRVITSIYQIKAKWYGPTFAPPHNYVRGPLINDQGNSF